MSSLIPKTTSGMSSLRTRHVTAPEDEVIHPGAVLRLIRRRWRVIVLSTLLTTAIAITYIELATPKYEASAALRIDAKQDNLPSVVTTVPTGVEILTDLDELKSRSLAAEVVDSLGLRLELTSPRRIFRSQLLSAIRVAAGADTGEYRLKRQSHGGFAVTGPKGTMLGTVTPGSAFNAAGIPFVLSRAAQRHPLIAFRILDDESVTSKLLRDARIRRSGPQTNIVDMTYADPDPVLARDVLNTWASIFVAHRQQVRTAEARTTAAVIKAQLDTLSPELAASENALRSFREKAQVVNPQAEGNAQMERFTALQAQRSEVEAERRALSQTLEGVAADAAKSNPGDASPYQRLLGFPTLLRNPAASEMLHSLAGAENERAALLTRRTMHDSDVRLLTERINQLEEQIKGLGTTYVQGLTAQVESMDRSLAQFGAQLSAVPGKEITFTRLQRTPEILAQLVTTLQTRLKEAQIAAAVTDPSVRVIDAAILPSRPISPRKGVDLALGVVLGLLLGVAAAVARARHDDSIQSRTDLHWATGVPVLAIVPHSTNAQALMRPLSLSSPRQVSVSHPGGGRIRQSLWARGRPTPQSINGSIVEDAFARLDLNLSASGIPNAKVLLFTSALPGEGKTTTAAGFAVTLARLGRHVVLVDADLRRGMVHTLFGGSRAPGLAEVLHGTSAETVLRSFDVSGPGSLSYVSSGKLEPSSGQLLRSGEIQSLLDQLRERFDTVVLDSPPLNVVADAVVLAGMVDAVIVIARAGVTAPIALQFALDQLQRVNAPIAGTVLTDVDPRRDEGYEMAYRYYGIESDDTPDTPRAMPPGERVELSVE